MPGPGGRAFWASALVGWGIIALAVRGLLSEAEWAGNPDGFARFLLGSALVHDLLVAPLAAAAGVLVARAVPAAVRPPVQGALIASAVVIAFAWPLVRGYGRAATNPSALPWNYAHSLALVLAAVWGMAAALAAWRLARLRTGRRSR